MRSGAVELYPEEAFADFPSCEVAALFAGGLGLGALGSTWLALKGEAGPFLVLVMTMLRAGFAADGAGFCTPACLPALPGCRGTIPLAMEAFSHIGTG